MWVFLPITSRALTALCHCAGYIAVTALIFLIVSATVDVAYRSVSGQSLFYGLLEYGEVALIVLAFFGALRAQLVDGHVSSTIVTSRLKGRTTAWIRSCTLLLVALLFFWAAYAASIAAISSFNSGETRFGLVRIELWPARAVVAISLAGLGLLCLRNVIEQAFVALGQKPAFEVLVDKNDDLDTSL